MGFHHCPHSRHIQKIIKIKYETGFCLPTDCFLFPTKKRIRERWKMQAYDELKARAGFFTVRIMKENILRTPCARTQWLSRPFHPHIRHTHTKGDKHSMKRFLIVSLFHQKLYIRTHRWKMQASIWIFVHTLNGLLSVA